MEFFSSIFLAVTTFFGFAPAEMENQVVVTPIAQEAAADTSADVVVITEVDNAQTTEEATTVSFDAEALSVGMETESNTDATVLTGDESMGERSEYAWVSYQKPSEAVLKAQLDSLTFKVTQKEGTERAGSSPLDVNWEDGIYVDVLSGEPLYSSKDKFDSGTGWPSFDRPITASAVTEHEDRKLFTTRTEIRSTIADNHIGHVFTDGPRDTTGLRHCMNGAALKFVPKTEMEAKGYGDFLQYL